MKLFYTGPFVNAEMLVVMLDKHGIAATQSFADSAAPEFSCQKPTTTAPLNSFTPSAKMNFEKKF
jgi:hypothetical protein